jgi:hypothetical protein
VKPLTIFVFLLSLLLGGLIVYSLRDARNGWYEFCTTQTYGWPFAWRIENCECDGQGGQTEFPSSTLAMNSGAILAFGLANARLVGLLFGPTKR